jgi:hypothetical protein
MMCEIDCRFTMDIEHHSLSIDANFDKYNNDDLVAALELDGDIANSKLGPVPVKNTTQTLFDTCLAECQNFLGYEVKKPNKFTLITGSHIIVYWSGVRCYIYYDENYPSAEYPCPGWFYIVGKEYEGSLTSIKLEEGEVMVRASPNPVPKTKITPPCDVALQFIQQRFKIGRDRGMIEPDVDVFTDRIRAEWCLQDADGYDREMVAEIWYDPKTEIQCTVTHPYRQEKVSAKNASYQISFA